MEPAETYDYVAIDALNLVYRRWWALRDLKTSTGVYCGMEYGYLDGLLHIIEKYAPAIPIMCWDGRPTRCLDLYPEYKANRTDDKKGEEPPWGPRCEHLMLLSYPMIPSLYHPEEEADEQIARLVSWAEVRKKRTLIISNDKDMQQLVSEYTHVFNGKSLFQVADVEREWGVPPRKLSMLRALMGDTSDNVKPPADRVTKKVKLQLVQESECLRDVLDLIDKAKYLTKKTREKLQMGRDILVRNYAMMHLRGMRPIPRFLAPYTGDSSYIIQLCELLEFQSLLSRMVFQPYTQVEELGIGEDDVTKFVHTNRSEPVGSVHTQEDSTPAEEVP